jgi:hypothetical protein
VQLLAAGEVKKKYKLPVKFKRLLNIEAGLSSFPVQKLESFVSHHQTPSIPFALAFLFKQAPFHLESEGGKKM